MAPDSIRPDPTPNSSLSLSIFQIDCNSFFVSFSTLVGGPNDGISVAGGWCALTSLSLQRIIYKTSSEQVKWVPA